MRTISESCFRGVTQAFAPLAERRSIDFDVALPDLDLCFFFDADLMEKVFTNLLSNAFKFTEEGGTVRVSLKEVEDSWGALERRGGDRPRQRPRNR